jgi:hypothetical protein
MLIADESSIVNGVEFWRDTVSVSQRVGIIEGLERTHRLIRMTVVLDGVFRLDVSTERVARPLDGGSWCVTEHPLELSTGRVAVVTRRPEPAFLQVAPGRYDVTIAWSVSEESKHYVSAVDEYPAGDGPDGMIWLEGRMA